MVLIRPERLIEFLRHVGAVTGPAAPWPAHLKPFIKETTMTTELPYTLTNESVTIIHEGRPFTFGKGTVRYPVLRSAILTEDWNGVRAGLTEQGSLQQWLGNLWTAGDGTLEFAGQPVPHNLYERIKRLVATGESPAPLFRFYERLAKNPSRRSVTQLFNFLGHANIPLEEDGRFLAYKGIKADLTDKHTGTIDNTPGTRHQMARNLVSDDPQEACHFGFHVGALSYASTFAYGGEVVICRVDPEHVVCVPNDYSHQKMRVCEYEVIGFHSGVPLSSDIHREEPMPGDARDWRARWDAANEEDQDDESDEADASTPVEEFNLVAMEEVSRIMEAGFEAELNVADATANAPKPAPKKPAPNLAAKFRKLKPPQLMEQSIEDLRAYAGHTLKIVGVSKIPGGKAALVSKIASVRRRRK